MLPHVGQGANQAIEDAVALAVLLSHADSVTEALECYERVRMSHAAKVQQWSRANGARYDASASAADLTERDRQLSNQARDRAWMWQADAEADALKTLRT
jgi:salicylate hydroxylase